jgi:hypothetical protein
VQFFVTPAFAFAFGLFLLCAETCLHFASVAAAPADLSSWPIYDWVAGFFLMYGAARASRDWLTGRMWLVAAWAFTGSLLFGAFFELLGELLTATPPPADEWVPLPLFVALVGVLLILSVGGLLAVLRSERFRVPTL